MGGVIKLSLAELEAFDPRARQGGAERRFCCPFCGSEKKIDTAHRSLALNTETGAWQCHRCRENGKITEFWTDRRPERTRETTFNLRKAPPRLPPRPCTPEIEMSAGALTIGGKCFRMLGLLEAASRGAADYLAGRGISAEIAAASGVMFAPDWHGRPSVVFPLHDGQGRLVAAQGRRIDPHATPKALSGGPISHGVFATAGAWEAATATGRIVLTEAPLDALSLAACGFPALALCGSTMRPEWLIPRCAHRQVLLGFDTDEGGDEAAAWWEAELSFHGADTERLRPVGGKDWNEILTGRGRKWLSAWVQTAIFGEMPPRPTLEEFAHSGRILRVRADVLGEVIYFAADNADLASLPDGAVIYRPREMASVLGVSEGCLRLLHDTKRLFSAPIEDEASDATAR